MLRRGLYLGLQRCLCSSRRATPALQSVRICLPRCLLKSYLQSQMQSQAKEQSRLRRAMIRCQSQYFAFKLQDYSYLSARKARLSIEADSIGVSSGGIHYSRSASLTAGFLSRKIPNFDSRRRLLMMFDDALMVPTWMGYDLSVTAVSPLHCHDFLNPMIALPQYAAEMVKCVLSLQNTRSVKKASSSAARTSLRA